MKKYIAVVIAIFFALVVPSISQKKSNFKPKKVTPPTPTQQIKLKMKVKEAGSDYVTLSIRGVIGEQIVLLGKGKDSTVKAGRMPTFSPKDTIWLTGLNKIEGKWLIANDTSLQNKEICIKGLTAKEDYFLLVYQKKDEMYRLARSMEFNTLAEEPTRQASKIVILNKVDKSIEVKWLRGTGEGRLLVGKRGNKTNPPDDGKEYEIEKYKLRGKHIFADLKGRESKFEFKDLEPGRWTIQIFEYNGEGKYRNYLLNQADNNPRQVLIPLDPPVVDPPKETTEEGFIISWSAVDGVVTYYIDIATDDNFEHILPEYTEVDIGNINEIEIQGLESKTRYYFRIKAKTKDNWTKWSKGILVETK